MIDVSAGNRYYYFCDGLGSVVALLHNSAVVEMYFYDAFGRTLIYKLDTQDWDSRSSFFGNRFMFTGREYDAESRLYYYRARMYHAGIGRFLQTDPIGYADSMNLYAYCGNNPVNWLDPWGLDTLGIHSNDSHSWISYTTDDGNTTTYGLWHRSRTNKNTDDRLRPDSDVYKNKERSYDPSMYDSRYHELSDEQAKKAKDFINRPHTYCYPTNNCSSFASDATNEIVGEDVDADSWLGLEMPEELRDNIRELEKKDPTTKLAPKPAPSMKGKPSGSSSSESYSSGF